jgi:hypothetical protein
MKRLWQRFREAKARGVFNLCPDEDRYGRLFKRLLIAGLPWCILFHLIYAVVILFDDQSLDLNGTPVPRIWGALLSLLGLPISMLSLAFAGATNFYFGRRIPIIKHAVPRKPDDISREYRKANPPKSS